MNSSDTRPTSTGKPGDSDYDADEALRQVRALGPRPAPPKQRLHAEMNPKLRDLDWNGHIPTAPVRTVADWGNDDDKPAIPTVPRQRQASDRYTPEQADLAHTAAMLDDLYGWGYGGLSANRAFGEPAIGSAA